MLVLWQLLLADVHGIECGSHITSKGVNYSVVFQCPGYLGCKVVPESYFETCNSSLCAQMKDFIQFVQKNKVEATYSICMAEDTMKRCEDLCQQNTCSNSSYSDATFNFVTKTNDSVSRKKDIALPPYKCNTTVPPPAEIAGYSACQSEILKSDILKTRVVMEIMCPTQVDCAAISGE